MNRKVTRRHFLANTSTAVTAGTLVGTQSTFSLAQEEKLPNILWITSEDNGPQMGCYGDDYADTPNLDRLAARGAIYRYAWSTAPVCAPARTCIISGMYANATGSQHMRSMASLPAGMKMYPQYLREKGYYCTNNRKEDYNLQKPGEVWDESSGSAHYKNRKPGQPFFAIFNFTTTHESQIRKRPHDFKHDPGEVRVPAYHPDTPEVRKDWAQYHDKMSEMDAQVGKILDDLEEAGLSEDTIIFYYGDHGPGMPRGKRWPYNSGLHVPMVVYVPEKFIHLAPKGYEPGAKLDRLVGFVDLAPTVLSLAGIRPPKYMQGQAFMGKYETPEPEFAFGFRGRMDERYDMVRSVRDQRYIYIKNYMPHKIYGQRINYMFQTPTTQVWKKLYDQGELDPPKTYFWETKPAEEMYDLEKDPDEVNNLADSEQHQDILNQFRRAQRQKALEIRDIGFLPEPEIHSRSQGMTPYEMAHDESKYPLNKIMRTADLASSLKEGVNDKLYQAMQDDDSAVRYWGILGLIMRGEDAVKESTSQLHEALKDNAPCVRVAACEALGEYGSEEDLEKVLPELMELSNSDKSGALVATMALNVVDQLGEQCRPYKDQIAKLPKEDPNTHGRMNSYTGRLLQTIMERFES